MCAFYYLVKSELQWRAEISLHFRHHHDDESMILESLETHILTPVLVVHAARVAVAESARVGKLKSGS